MSDAALADRCAAYANRLSEMTGGSGAADVALHALFVQLGAVAEGSRGQRYSTSVEALRRVLPAGYVIEQAASSMGSVYWVCRAAGMPDYPLHAQWGTTAALATAGAVLRMFAWLARQ